MPLMPSPSRLKPSDIIRIVRPGRIISYGAVKKYVIAALAKLPSSIVSREVRFREDWRQSTLWKSLVRANMMS